MPSADDQVLLITGASSGLGEATARALSAQGAHVVLGARRQDRIQMLAHRTEDTVWQPRWL